MRGFIVSNYSWLLIVPILAVLVIVHEFGHFLTARFFGVKVEEFGVGLPPRIIGREWKGTLWSLNWIPLGGFARMKDENTAGEAPDSFQSKPAYARAIILLGGIIFNLVFASLLFIGVLAFYGAPTGEATVFVGAVTPNTPAEATGWRIGDQITRVGDASIGSAKDLMGAISAAAGKPTQVTLVRNGQTMATTITPRVNPPAGQGALGITLRTQDVYARESLGQAIPDGFSTTLRGAGSIFGFLGQLIHNTAPGGLAGNVSGPIGIARTVGEVVNTSTTPGWVSVFNLSALISINLAVFNLLPIPALDGGRLLFVIIEILRRGRRVPPEREGMVHVIGMAVLLSIFVLVAFHDIQGIFDGRSVLPR